MLLDEDFVLARRIFDGPVHPASAILVDGRVAAQHVGVGGPAIWDALAATAASR